MADLNQIISLGIGTPADIKHLILFGLSASPLSGDQGVGTASGLATVTGVSAAIKEAAGSSAGVATVIGRSTNTLGTATSRYRMRYRLGHNT